MKLIVRIKGGLGNQLFCYAAARRLSLVSNAELVIDDTSGFLRDRMFRRNYSLDHFNIEARKSTPSERLEPFERYRRALIKLSSRLMPFQRRNYIEQDGNYFDFRLLQTKISGTVYLDGLWQSEDYFKDYANIIRKDLIISPPIDQQNIYMAKKILSYTNSVAIHVRFFSDKEESEMQNFSSEYFNQAFLYLKSKLQNPHFFLFSNKPNQAVEALPFLHGCCTVISNNFDDKMAYADLWMMGKCRHLVTHNSTFSWWAAWLGEVNGGLIIAPQPSRFSFGNFWRQERLLPKRWIKL